MEQWNVTDILNSSILIHIFKKVPQQSARSIEVTLTAVNEQLRCG